MAHADDRVAVRDQNGARKPEGKRDPDALVKEIERTRENLARTIDALATRVSPANNMRRLTERAREQAARPEIQLAAAAVAIAAIGLALLAIRRRRG